MTKRKFIIDTSVIMCAAKLCDSQGNNDVSAHTAIMNIIHKCHRIVLTNKINNEYFLKLSILQKENEIQIDLSRLLHLAAITSGKMIWMNDELEPVVGEELIHKNDTIFLRLLRISKGILVTNDQRLLKTMEYNDFNNKFGDIVISPNEVDDYI